MMTSKANSTTLTTSKWSKIGDTAHLLTIANALIFAYSVVFYNSSPIFDPLWRPQGFCVMNQEIPFFNSHDLCLYVDTVGSVLVGLLYWFLKDRPGMTFANDLVKFNVFGIFAHGVGHGGLAKAIRNGDVSSSRLSFDDDFLQNLTTASLPEYASTLGGLLFFWIMLLKATMPSVSFKTVIPFAIGNAVMNVLLPPQFGFTFVQTVLLASFSINQLMRPKEEKGRVYAIFPAMVSFPICCIGWLESTQCSNFIIHIGGHLVYDAYIPFSTILFYLVCFNYLSNEVDFLEGGVEGKPKAA